MRDTIREVRDDGRSRMSAEVTRALARRPPRTDALPSCQRFQRTVQLRNDEGNIIALGLIDRRRYYCGRYLGRDLVPGSDGRCGVHDGPQCASCRRFQRSIGA